MVRFMQYTSGGQIRDIKLKFLALDICPGDDLISTSPLIRPETKGIQSPVASLSPYDLRIYQDVKLTFTFVGRTSITITL